MTRLSTRWTTRSIGLVMAAGLAVGGLAAAPGSAAAEESVRTVSGGTISWGLKSSFRSYVVGSIANGSITATSPATDDGTQTTFASATGSWSAQTASVATSGSVTFTGHSGALNVVISNPTIVISSGAATLVVDAVDSSGTTLDDLVLADLTLTDAYTRSGNVVQITDAPATLTSAGTALFALGNASFYSAGATLDPVDASFELEAEAEASASTTTLASVSSTYGTAAKVVAKVSGGSGTVTLTGFGGSLTSTVKNGSATFTLPKSLSVGTRTLKAAYSGDSDYQASSGTGRLVVKKASIGARSVSVKKVPTRKKTGRAVVTVAGVSGAAKPSGQVRVRLKNGAAYRYLTVSLSSGAKRFTLPKLAKGKWYVAVRYLGDGNYVSAGYRTVGGFTVKK